MIRHSLLACLLVVCPLIFGVVFGSVPAITESAAHPDHGAPFPEQLAGQWVLGDGNGEDVSRLRLYEDGRFAFFGGESWTAGSYFILRSDERQKGILRLEYYLDGNLHFEEVRCEIHFEVHGDHAHEEEDHAHKGHEGHEHEHEAKTDQAEHHHEYMMVEALPSAEMSLGLSGDYLHVH